jgi:hypothetical protein
MGSPRIANTNSALSTSSFNFELVSITDRWSQTGHKSIQTNPMGKSFKYHSWIDRKSIGMTRTWHYEDKMDGLKTKIMFDPDNLSITVINLFTNSALDNVYKGECFPITNPFIHD